MAPVDLESLFCGRGACESKYFVSSDDPIIEDPDLPPESVHVLMGDDLRWLKINKVLDRGPSTIGNANPKSSRSTSNPKSYLQRLNAGGFIKPPNGPIFGLPNSTFHCNVSRPLPTPRIFPLNYSIGRKPAVPDPGSPKVSCFGNVLSEGEKELGRRSSVGFGEAELVKVVGCWTNLAMLFGFSGVYPAVSGEIENDVSQSTNLCSEEDRKTVDSAVPELQGMKRFFKSGRRSCSRVDDVDVSDDEHVVSLEPLDRECVLKRS